MLHCCEEFGRRQSIGGQKGKPCDNCCDGYGKGTSQCPGEVLSRSPRQDVATHKSRDVLNKMKKSIGRSLFGAVMNLRSKTDDMACLLQIKFFLTKRREEVENA